MQIFNSPISISILIAIAITIPSSKFSRHANVILEWRIFWKDSIIWLENVQLDNNNDFYIYFYYNSSLCQRLDQFARAMFNVNCIVSRQKGCKTNQEFIFLFNLTIFRVPNVPSSYMQKPCCVYCSRCMQELELINRRINKHA